MAMRNIHWTNSTVRYILHTLLGNDKGTTMKKKVDPDWTTSMGRVKWILASRYGGNRSAMAKDTGVSLTGIIKVITGQQNPGRRLMEKIVQSTDISPAWLLAGEGQPLTGSALPVAIGCLPGPPTEGHALLTDERVSELTELYSSSRYWLKLGAAEPVVKASGISFRVGDLLLMDTDRTKFPPVEQLNELWGVVRVQGRRESRVQLAALSYYTESEDNGPAHLEAETYEHHPQVITRVKVDIYPDGRIETSGHSVCMEQPKGGDSKPSKQRWQSSILSHMIDYENVVAVCVLFVRRFGG